MKYLLATVFGVSLIQLVATMESYNQSSMDCLEPMLERIQQNASLSSGIHAMMNFLFHYTVNYTDIDCNMSTGLGSTGGGNSTNPDIYCEGIPERVKTVIQIMFLAAAPYCVIFLVWASFKPRHKAGYIAPLSASRFMLNFTTRRRHLPDAAIFCLIAMRLCPILSKSYYWAPPHSQHFPSVPICLLNTVLIMVAYFPLLVAVSHTSYITTQLLGMAYLAPIVWISALEWKECMSSGAPNVLIWPKLLGQLVLFVTFILDALNNISDYLTRKCRPEVAIVADRDLVHYVYVRQLLRNKDKDRHLSRAQRIILQFKTFRGFNFSNRLVCTLIASSIALTKMYIVLHRRREADFAGIDRDFQQWYPVFHLTKNTTWIYDVIKDFVDTTNLCLSISLKVSYAFHYLFIVHMFFSYRQHMLRLYRGDKSWYTCDPPQMTLALMYPGYQVGYVIFGVCAFYFVIIIFAFLFALGIAVPVRHGIHSTIGAGFISLWPGIVCTIVLAIVQGIVCKVFMIRDKNTMTIYNRLCYDIMSYLFFFLHVVQGLFNCLLRSLKTIILWGALLCRLDRYAMSRTLEKSDPGIEAYLSMLIADVHHSHPVMLTFVELLKTQVAKNNIEYTETTRLLVNTETRRSLKQKRCRNRWFKAITLINNPSLQHTPEQEPEMLVHM